MTLKTCNIHEHPMNLKAWERADPNLFSIAEADFNPKTALSIVETKIPSSPLLSREINLDLVLNLGVLSR
jgi:hypothetical protein